MDGQRTVIIIGGYTVLYAATFQYDSFYFWCFTIWHLLIFKISWNIRYPSCPNESNISCHFEKSTWVKAVS